MQENPRGRVTGVCKLSKPVGLHPKDKRKLYSHSSGRQRRSSDRTLATQRSGRPEDSWKLLEQSTPGKMENNVDRRDVKEIDEGSEPIPKGCCSHEGSW